MTATELIDDSREQLQEVLLYLFQHDAKLQSIQSRLTDCWASCVAFTDTECQLIVAAIAAVRLTRICGAASMLEKETENGGL